MNAMISHVPPASAVHRVSAREIVSPLRLTVLTPAVYVEKVNCAPSVSEPEPEIAAAARAPTAVVPHGSAGG
jgi:hypothetical protein